MESTDTSVEDHRRHHQQQPQLPPGFRFHPTDEELVVHYLMRRAQSAPLPISIIAEVDLYKFDPWELPEKAVFGEHEWYFFSPRDRKYPNGARPNRAATSGYWKATGTDKPIFGAGNKKLGVKKALVFYGGKPPRGHKTNWIMHEYRLADNNNSNKPMAYGYNSNNRKGSLRLDDWVLCRIYKKNNAHRPTDHEREDIMENMMMMGSMAVANSINSNSNSNSKSSSNYINTSHDDQGICLQGIMNGNRQGLQVDPGISMVPSAASRLAANLPLKRALPSSLCWEGASSSKRVPALQDDDNDYNNSNNSTEVLQQQTLLGAISEGLFRQTYQVPGLNWYS